MSQQNIGPSGICIVILFSALSGAIVVGFAWSLVAWLP